MENFGFTITRVKDEEAKLLKSFVQPSRDDGAVNVVAGGTFGTYIDLDGTIKTEAELVSKYRQMALQPEVEKAINEVVNEAIVQEEHEETIELLMADIELPEKVKEVILQEFEYLLKMVDFAKNGYDIFKRWYIDGRLYHHIIVDEDRPEEGIKELRYIDPRKIRKIREIIKQKDPKTGAMMTYTKKEYYLYSSKGLNTGARMAGGTGSNLGTTGLKIEKDSIIHTVSGLMDQNNTMVLSYLHPAIKALNQLRALEDATLIYHLSRAPERRVFYIDVGNLPKARAEQHVKDMMVKHKNKISYNATTGETSDQRKFMHMLEDYWLPRREGGRGTEISVLQGGTQLPDLLQSVEYFQDRLYRGLQVPLTRMKPDAIYNIGRATEITRDEVNFSKFIDRVRNKFMEFLTDALCMQLVLKKVMTPEEWDEIKHDIRFKFARDNYFSELKDLEIMNDRLMRLADADQFAGKYYSHQSLRRDILRQSDDDILEQDDQIHAELDNEQYYPPVPHDEVQSNLETLPPAPAPPPPLPPPRPQSKSSAK